MRMPGERLSPSFLASSSLLLLDQALGKPMRDHGVGGESSRRECEEGDESRPSTHGLSWEESSQSVGKTRAAPSGSGMGVQGGVQPHRPPGSERRPRSQRTGKSVLLRLNVSDLIEEDQLCPQSIPVHMNEAWTTVKLGGLSVRCRRAFVGVLGWWTTCVRNGMRRSAGGSWTRRTATSEKGCTSM